MMFNYLADDIVLELQSPFQNEAVFTLIDSNRDFIGRYESWVDKFQSLEDMPSFLGRDLQGMAKGRRWSWLMVYKGQAAGRISLYITTPHLGECEIGYWLGETFTGKGIVTRAVRTVIDFAFTELNLRHILIGFNPDNVKSKAIPQRLGFQPEFMFRQDDYVDGSWHDLQFYGLLRDEWDVTSHPTFALPVSDNLYLRLQQLHHADLQFPLIQQNLDDLQQWFFFASDEHTLEKEHAFTKHMLEKYAKGTGMMLGIWDNDDLVGSIGLHIDREDNKAAVGYWLDKDARGQNIMTRCVQAVLGYCFIQRNLHRVELRAAVDNVASRRVAEKVGMQQEAILRHEMFLNGRFVDQVLYGILAEEYFNQ